MAVVATLLVRVAANLTELDKTFSELERAADRIAKTYAKLGGQLQGIGSKLTTGITLPLAGIGAVAAKSAMDFDSAMRGVMAAIDPTKDELDSLKAAAIEWGQKTQFSATEAAQALAELGKAGVKSTDAVALLPNVLNLATVGEMDLAEAAGLTTDTLAQFNLETKDAGRVNDVLAAGAQKSTTSVKELREAMVAGGSTAASFGMSIEEVTGGLAAFANQGLKGEKAGTALKNVVTAIINPMKGMKDVLGELKIDTLASADGTVHLTEVIDKLGKAGASEAQVVRAFGEVAGPIMVGMVGKGTQALVDMNAQMEHAGGTADRVAKTLLSGLGGAWESMTGAIETASISIGLVLAPALEQAAALVGDLAEWVSGTLVPAFESLPSAVKITAGAFLGLLAAAGPLVYIAGTMAQSWSGLVGLFAKTSGAAGSAAEAAKGLATALTVETTAAKNATFWTSAFEGVVAVLVSPITGVVVAVGALVVGLRLVTGSWEGVVRALSGGLLDFERLGRLWEGLKTLGAGVADGFTVLRGGIGEAVSAIVTKFEPAIADMRRLVVDVAAAIRKPLIEAMKELGVQAGTTSSDGNAVAKMLLDIGRALAVESVFAQFRGQLVAVTGAFSSLAQGLTLTINMVRGQLLTVIELARLGLANLYVQVKAIVGVFGIDLPKALAASVGWLKSFGLDLDASSGSLASFFAKLAGGLPTLSDMALRARLGADGFAALKASQAGAGDAIRSFVPEADKVAGTLKAAGLATGKFGDELNLLSVGGGVVVRSITKVNDATERSATVSKEAAAAAKKAAEEAKKAAEELQKLVDTMSGAAVVQKARDLMNVLAELSKRGLMPSAAGAKELTDAIEDAAVVVHGKGGQIEDDMAKIWDAFTPTRGLGDDLRSFANQVADFARGLVPSLKQNLKPMQAALLNAFRIDPKIVGKQLEDDLERAAIGDRIAKAFAGIGTQLKTQVSGILGSMFTGQTGMVDGFRAMFGELQQVAVGLMTTLVKEIGTQLSKGVEGNLGAIFGGKDAKKGAAAGAAVGLVAGLAFGQAFGKEVGALAGAASGAAAGAMVGSWVGAGVGAGVGFVTGWLAGMEKENQQRQALAAARADLVAQFGSVSKLSKAARQAGVDFDQMWSTDRPEEFNKWLTIMQNGLAANRDAVEGVNKALDTTIRTGSLLSRINLTDVGVMTGRAGSDATKARGALPGSEEGAFAFIQSQQDAALKGIDTFLSNVVVKTKQGAAAISSSLAGVYATLLEGGATPTQAFAQLEPTIAKLNAQLAKTGFSGSAAFGPLAALADMAASEIGGPVMDAMAGLDQALGATFNLGLLNRDTFAGFAEELLQGFKTMEAQGKGGEVALSAMQGGLQKLWELSTDFGYSLTEDQQAMVNFAKESGTVGDQFRPAADRMANAIDGLVERMDRFLLKFEDIEGAASQGAKAISSTLGNVKLPPLTQSVELDVKPPEGAPPGWRYGSGSGTYTYQTALGSGGVVSRPTVALIGESGPEAVVPLGKDFNSGTDVTLMLDSEVLTRAVLRKQPRIMRAYGAAR